MTCKKKHLYSQHLGECPECVTFSFKNYQKEYHFQTTNIPPELLALIAQAIQAYKQEDAATVLRLMTQVIDSGKAPMEAFAYRAWAYQQQGDTKTALRDVQHAIKHLPNFPFSYYVLGRCQFDLQQYTEAETAFSQAITWKYEDMYQLYYWRGLTYKAMNSDAKAEADFKQALHSPSAYWRKQAHQQLKQMKPTDDNALPVFVNPPAGVSLQETATNCTITIQPVWWQRLAWSLVLLSGNGLMLLLLVAFWASWGGCVGLGLIGLLAVANWYLAPYVVSKIINRTRLTLEKSTLSMTAGPIAHSRQQFNLKDIREVYCFRELANGSSPNANYHLVYSQYGSALKNITTDYPTLRYIVWKLRHYLNLPDTPTACEYVPGLKAMAHCKTLGFKSIAGYILVLLLTLFICVGGSYLMKVESYGRWQDLQSLYESNQTVMATVTNKSIIINKNDQSYYISYRYQAKFPGSPTFNQRESVSSAYYDSIKYYNGIKPPVEIKVLYATRKPSVSRIADRFSKGTVDSYWENYQFFSFGLQLGIVIIGGLILFGLYNIWLVLQLDRQGKLIKGVVTATKHRTWSDKNGKYDAYDVYYRYLGYESRFAASKAGFSEVRDGQAIEVCYLPSRPHISRPYPLEKYCG